MHIHYIDILGKVSPKLGSYVPLTTFDVHMFMSSYIDILGKVSLNLECYL